jgi:hypothetical protein
VGANRWGPAAGQGAEMTLTTEFGRIDRYAVVQRAKQLHKTGKPWGECMREAHREAAEELRAKLERVKKK